MGDLKIWQMPDKKIKISNRYALFADIGGRTESADYSVIKVLDRYWLSEGGVPEVVAVWRGHMDQDLFAWVAVQLAKFYNNGLLAVESNSLRKAESEGDHFLTVLDEISNYYDNLYARTSPEKVKQGVPVQYGFHTNVQTKTMIIDGLLGATRDMEYIERDLETCDEMDVYEIKENGSYGAVDGEHDDLVMTTAGVFWLSNSYMDMPKEIIRRNKENGSRGIISEATI